MAARASRVTRRSTVSSRLAGPACTCCYSGISPKPARITHADVAAFVEAVRPSGHVLVIDLTSLTAPQFDMQQFIESAVLSMAPVVAARLTKDGEPSVGLTRLELEGSDRRARGVVGVSGFSDPFW